MPPNSTKLPFCLLLGQEEAGRGRAGGAGGVGAPQPPSRSRAPQRAAAEPGAARVVPKAGSGLASMRGFPHHLHRMGPPACPESTRRGLPGSCQHLRGQVDGEKVLGHQALAHHVVKNRGSARGGDAGEGQPQEAIKGRLGKEGAGLRQAQPKHLVRDLDVPNLVGRTGRLGDAPASPPGPAPCPGSPTGAHGDGVISQDADHAAGAVPGGHAGGGAAVGGGARRVEAPVVGCSDGRAETHPPRGPRHPPAP